MDSIPPQYKKLAESAELYDEVIKVGTKFDLRIDQIGELDAEIRDVLNGVAKSSEFVKDISSRMEIDASLAKKIAEDINSGILMALKSNTQVPPTTTIQGNMVEKHISAVESAGGFSVIREAPPAPGSLPGVQTGVFSEPLADHLLARPHAEELQSAELAEDHPLPRVTSKQAPEMRPTEPDPYRESVE